MRAQEGLNGHGPEEPEDHGGRNGRQWSPGFERRLEARNETGVRFNAFVDAEFERVINDESMPPAKKMALLHALDLMVSHGRTERVYGLQVYMHLTGQELPPTKSARTMQMRRKLENEKRDAGSHNGTQGARF